MPNDTNANKGVHVFEIELESPMWVDSSLSKKELKKQLRKERRKARKAKAFCAYLLGELDWKELEKELF